MSSTGSRRKLIVLDPGMDTAAGHHLSLNSELAIAGRDLGFDCSFYVGSTCSDAFRPEARVNWVPAFRTSPYLGVENKEEDLNSRLAATEELDADYAAIDFPDGACVLMHTSSPWHLKALARRLRDTDTRVAVGFMLATSYWTHDVKTARQLEMIGAEALGELQARPCFSYSESGLPEGTSTMLMPWSDETLAGLAAGDRKPPQEAGPVRFGYFGRPLGVKGFQELVRVLGSSGAGKRCFEFFFPPGFERQVEKLSRISPTVRASSRFRENRQYLADMQTVDVVVCFYDPVYYANQMSGIAVEAALLGKAVLVTRATAPHRFFTQFAPGCCLAVDFTGPALESALARPAEDWRRRQRRSRASMVAVRELARARRFFAVAFD